eukprot:gb/GECH01012157.1/.p1 GENE.gb/GECH01012157.1/~~gb/GECH01012157.1/.p1  ORF type:complete len:620 (+),score=127.20 gb/GECH01012157.1/:1-1860(+)
MSTTSECHDDVTSNNNSNTNNNNNNEPHPSLDPLSLLQVSGNGTHIAAGLPHHSHPVSSFPELPSDSPSNHWSHDGSLMLIIEKDAVRVLDVTTAAAQERLRFPSPSAPVHAAYFSPTDRFVITYRRYSSRYTDPNLCVYRVSDGQPVLAVEQRVWPALAWSRDDGFLIRTMERGEGVEVYRVDGEACTLECVSRIGVDRMLSPKDKEQPKKQANDSQNHNHQTEQDKLPRAEAKQPPLVSSPPGPRITSLAVGGRSNNPPVAVFISKGQGQEGKGKLAVFRTLSLVKAQNKGRDGDRPPVKAISRLDVEQADKCTFGWNQQGSALLVRIASDVDISHRSYYGQTALYLLPSVTGNASFRRLVEKSSIHDVAWSPDGQHFVAVHGSPSQASLFTVRGKQTFEFGPAAHNTALWSPSGRFLLLGGFGNMSGAMTFWDVKTRTVLGKTNADSACQCSWAPDSRHVLTATTMPRMQVDNKVVIFDWTGNVVYRQPFDRLYHVEWQPVSPDRLPAPPSPRTLKQARKAQKEAEAAAPKKYTPPHARHDVPVKKKEEEKEECNHDRDESFDDEGRKDGDGEVRNRKGSGNGGRGRGRGRGGRGRGRGRGGKGRGRGGAGGGKEL